MNDPSRLPVDPNHRILDFELELAVAKTQQLGPEVQWAQSNVTDDKICCIYIAPDEASVRRHAELGGFPANSVAQVRSTIDPTTEE